jgi:saccharopine dehydrogenase (NAD+, L-lysine-forming)
VGCGFSPGISNIITRYVCDQIDRLERITIRVGRSPGQDADQVVSEWKPTWSPEILLEDTADPPMVYANGEYTEVPIFSNPEIYSFPEPVGDILLSSHNHEEPYLIPGFYQGKGLKDIDFKYPVDKLAGAFVKMGFAEQEAIDVKGVKVAPRDVLMQLVKRPRNSFIDENEDSILEAGLTGIMDITVDGEQGGEKISHVISYKFIDGEDNDLKQQLYKTYGTTRVYVALPAVVGAKMCTGGDAQRGVITPDSLSPKLFFEGMAQRGVPFMIEERIIKHTTFKY